MRKKSLGFFRGWLGVLAGVAMIGPCMAQNPPAASAAQGKLASCDAAGAAASSTASIVQATGESLQRKRWQPRGGIVQFTIRSFPAIPDKSSFYVCFRWKTTTPGDTGAYVQVAPDRLDRNNDGTTWTLTTTIPRNFPDVAPGKKRDKALPLVPLADVRIIVFDEHTTLAADVSTTIGITYPLWAILFALGTVFVALLALWAVTRERVTQTLIRQASWPLRIISTPSGYASLSQLQVVLWTLVVAASAVYVMSLSGDLIQITDGTLVLLGIAGATAIAAKVHTASQAPTAQTVTAATAPDQTKAGTQTPDQIKAAAQTPDQTTATTQTPDQTTATTQTPDQTKAATQTPDQIKAATQTPDQATPATQTPDQATPATKTPDQTTPATQTPDQTTATTKTPDQTVVVTRTPAQTLAVTHKPQWSDLIFTENSANGTMEIDVARFQMLLFTLITAVFVLMNVVTTYMIPEIPTGFLTLMGISNGVYLGVKVAQG
jgi:hypothetical protein